jgi:hypothetical protein
VSAGTHDLLFEALERRFDDGARRAVIVLGAGLHHHLRAQSSNPDENAWRYLTNWNGLLAEVAGEFNLPAVMHEDPAATWESLVTRIASFKKAKVSKQTGSVPQVNTAEAEALAVLARKLTVVPAAQHALEALGRGISQYRDVVSLNIDLALDTALERAGASLTFPTVPPDMRSLRATVAWSQGDRKGRIWQPHGAARVPAGIVLGTRAYGRSLAGLHRAWDIGKQAEGVHPNAPPAGEWTPELAAAWWSERRAVPPFEPAVGPHKLRLTWLDLFIGSELVFIGTGLDRAETDLWWALHMRQRNLARVPPRQRPGTFALFAKGQRPGHLETGPAGVLPVIFQTWTDAWDMIFSRSGGPNVQ